MSQHLGHENANDDYVKSLLGMAAAGQIPEAGAFLVDILHDEGCGLLVSGSRCDCDPEIRIHGGVRADLSG